MIDNFKMVIFSDLHYAPERPVNNGSRIDNKLTRYSLPLLDKMIEKINDEIKPNIVFNLGDLIEDFNDKEKDIENLKFIWKKFKKINCDFYSLAGNHDLRTMNSRIEVEKIMGYNHSTFSFDKNGYHFVMLGLEVNDKIGNEEGGIFKTQFISNEDLIWLENDLKLNNLPCFIFSHFGIAEDDMKGNFWFEKNPKYALMGNRKELKSIFKSNKNILAIFSGHQHWTKLVVEDGLKYYVVGSMIENINGDGNPDGVYYEIQIIDKKLNVIENHIKI